VSWNNAVKVPLLNSVTPVIQTKLILSTHIKHLAKVKLSITLIQ